MNWLKEQAVNWMLGLAFGGMLIGACWVADVLSDLIIG